MYSAIGAGHCWSWVCVWCVRRVWGGAWVGGGGERGEGERGEEGEEEVQIPLSIKCPCICQFKQCSDCRQVHVLRF